MCILRQYGLLLNEPPSRGFVKRLREISKILMEFLEALPEPSLGDDVGINADSDSDQSSEGGCEE